MSSYLLTYDLRNESGSQDYEALYKEMERLRGHRTLLSVWLVAMDLTPKGVADHFMKFLDKDDRIWVTRLRESEHHFIRAMSGTNAWIENYPPG